MARPSLISIVFLVAGPAWAAAPDGGTRLEYTRAPGAERCPDREAVRAGVAARLGYDPFSERGARVLRCQIAPEGTGYRSQIEVEDAQGKTTGARTLTSHQSDCGDLAPALLLVLSLAARPPPPAPTPLVATPGGTRKNAATPGRSGARGATTAGSSAAPSTTSSAVASSATAATSASPSSPTSPSPPPEAGAARPPETNAAAARKPTSASPRGPVNNPTSQPAEPPRRAPSPPPEVNPTPAPTASRSAEASPPPPSAVAESPVEARDAPRARRRDAHPPSPFRGEAGLGAIATAGAAPHPSWGGTATAGLARGDLSTSLEARVDAPFSVGASPNRVSLWTASLALVPCWHRGAFAGCGIVGGGVVRGSGLSSDGGTHANLGPWLGAGLRPAWRIPLGDSFGLVLHGDLLAVPIRTVVLIGDSVAWRMPWLSGALGLLLVWDFR